MSELIISNQITSKEEYERAIANVMNRGRDSFVGYDVASDCIDPLTGAPLFKPYDEPMVKYYAKANNKIDYDPAVSLEANIIYEKAYRRIINMVDSKIIRRQCGEFEQNKYNLKYELGEPNCTGGLSYRGITMNLTDKANYSYYWNHKELHRRVTGKYFQWPDEAIEFFSVYHAPGNFMILPWRKNLDINYCNQNGWYGGAFDFFLLAIYNFFLEMNGKEPLGSINLNQVIGYGRTLLFLKYYLFPFIEYDRKKIADDKPRQWIDDLSIGGDLDLYIIPGWESFVEWNLLQDFVTNKSRGHYTEPRELWNGSFDSYCSRKGYSFTDRVCLEYWKNATEMIRKRSARIYDRIHNREEEDKNMQLTVF